jgi:hypothetical protein
MVLVVATGLTTAMEDRDMATTKKKGTTKKAATSRGRKAPATKAKKASGPKAEKPNRVFAIRVTDAELAAIHKAAGPRNATRFVRAVAAAFANGSEAGFRAVVKEAKSARS